MAFPMHIILTFYRTRVRSLVMLVSDSLTHSCLVNLIDVTLACEDGKSKLVEVVTVVDVNDEDRIGNNLLQIWEMRFGHKAIFFRYRSQGLIKIVNLKFKQDFEAGVWFIFCI